MRTVVRAFVLGAAALGIAGAVGAAAVLIVADAGGWSSFEAALGPLVLVAFERGPGGTAATIGPGLGLVALAGGVLNAAAAAFLRRRV